MLTSAFTVSFIGYVKTGGSPLGPHFTNMDLDDIISPEDISKIDHIAYYKIINESFYGKPADLSDDDFKEISDKYKNCNYTKIFSAHYSNNVHNAYNFKDSDNNELFTINDFNDNNLVLITYNNKTELYRIS